MTLIWLFLGSKILLVLGGGSKTNAPAEGDHSTVPAHHQGSYIVFRVKCNAF